jgi:hypothetical protein
MITVWISIAISIRNLGLDLNEPITGNDGMEHQDRHGGSDDPTWLRIHL